jgi:hypothetical protein
MEKLAEILDIGWVGNFVGTYSWVWPICEMFHFIGMALLIGTVGWLDLRILGIGKGVPIASLEKLVPLGIAGFFMNLVTGVVFVTGNEGAGGSLAYVANLAFQIKLLLILIAGANLAVYYFMGVRRAAETVAASGDAAPSAKIVAAVSLVLWFGVIFFGRLIMYNDTLLYALGL